MGLSACVTPAPTQPPPTHAEEAARFYALGIQLALEKNYGQALRAFQEAVVNDPLRYDAHYWAGICYYELGEYELELVEYNKCRALNPSYPPVWKALGHAYLASDDLEGAKRAYVRYLDWEPRDARVMFNLGLVVHDLGRGDEARALWRRCLRLDPEVQLREEAKRRLEVEVK